MSAERSTSESEKDDDEEEEDDEQPSYFGKRNAEGLPHGRGTLKWTRSENRFEGRFVDGSREGKGCFYFGDGSTLSGSYVSDELEGETVYTYSDGSCLVADYCNGEMEGPFTGYSPEGRVTVRGSHRGGRRNGFLQTFDDFGGSVIGSVDKEGFLSGEEIAYIYPDKTTFLIGQFEDGRLVKARYATLKDFADDRSTSVYNLTKLPPYSWRNDFPEIVFFDMSTRDLLSRQPLVCDAYEQDRVCVKKSLIENAKEGLFAKVDLKKNEIASFYNGVRLSHDEVDSRDWTLNDNTISLDEDTVIDVPVAWASMDSYCASLGHKANHSISPNCKYDPFYHPRFGEIKCIQTLRYVAAGEELTCDYGYHHKLPGTDIDDLPDWFRPS